jgi:hypothetical protein
MLRCAAVSLSIALTAFAGIGLALPASAQVQRNFPQTALRGELQITQPPEAVLNGQPVRLAPGARIRGEDNMLKMSGAMVGAKLMVHYTVDPLGLVYDVWILNEQERAKRPWPRTPKEAQTWVFDPIAQTWARR